MATEVKVPDIGDFKDVEVIDLLVKPGDSINAEDSLLTLETDKATMDVPAPAAGTVKEVKVKVGDKVSQGTLILLLDGDGASAAESAPSASSATGQKEDPAAAGNAKAPQGSQPEVPVPPEREAASAPGGAEAAASPDAQSASEHPSSTAAAAQPGNDDAGFTLAHASPSVRRFARELGVELSRITGSGNKNRILKEDVQAYVKSTLNAAPAAAAAGVGAGLPPLPTVDFAKFGAIEKVALSRIKKLSGANLHRNWMSIPHVTQHDEADITGLEQFRKSVQTDAAKQGIKITLLAFLMKAAVGALRQFPDFNASLEADGGTLVRKNYYHIGVAVDTPEGLVVPVVRDVDTKGVLQLGKELGELSERARAKKLSPGDMQGGSFSISSLGGIGGTAFTPIINAPEVAILGVSRAAVRPVSQDGQVAHRLMLPLSLSYDHRVIDGAAAARFTTFLCALLADMRRLVL